MLLAACDAPESSAAPEPWYPSVNAQGDPVFAVYQSRVPCLDEKALSTPRCEKVKLALALYRNRLTEVPTTYLLARVYVGDDSGRIVDGGSWTIGLGVDSDPEAQIYELDANAPADFRLYWALSDQVIFVLDRDRRPRIGNAGYGYALNRTK